MKMKTQLSLAAVMFAGLIASGCTQMAGQQVAQAAPEEAAPPPPKVTVITDCSKCPPKKGGGNTGGGAMGGMHTHPAIPGCTNSTTHSHPFTNRNHRHAYSCKGRPTNPVKPVDPVQPTQPPMNNNRWTHTHPAIPGCTNSMTHTHPYTDPNHTHRYSCRGNMGGGNMGGGNMGGGQVIVPPVKAKGNYRGPIQIDSGVMKQYQQ